MTRHRQVLGAAAAMTALAVVVVGVPFVLVWFVGNPWPGRTSIELRDEVAVVVGVLAVLAWLIWARFVLAIAVELRDQLAELRVEGRREPAERGEVVSLIAPIPRAGIGLLAQRLVATALIILPVATRAAPPAVATSPVALRGDRAPSALVVDAESPPATAPAENGERAGDRRFAPPDRWIVVAPGDTLIGLARAHLGQTERWREIYELNHDRPQADGGRLVSPSSIRSGWRLRLPAGGNDVESAPYLAPETTTIETGDTLWDLSHERLETAGFPHDDTSVAAHVADVVAANDDVVEDPNLIYPGEQFDFPAAGTPPPEPEPARVRHDRPEPEPAPKEPRRPTTPERPPREPATAPTATTAPAPSTTSPPATTSTPATTSATTTTDPSAPPATAPPAAQPEAPKRRSPSPIGIGQATLLSAGILALLAARRRIRLRAAQPRARVPEPPPEMVATERRLRAVDAGERLVRVDIGVRAAAASLVANPDGAQIAVVRAGADGAVELTLTGPASLPPPWDGDGDRWALPGNVPIELLADAARTVGAPCVALTQLGVDNSGNDVLVDLEALGLLAIDAPTEQADAVVRGLAATLASSVFAEIANLIGVGIDESAFLDHRQAHHAAHVDEALELAATLIGTTGSAKQPTFALRARHTGGEAWEPAVVLAGSEVAGEVTADVAGSAARRRGGLAMVVAGRSPDAPWALRAEDRRWVLEPAGLELVPVGLSSAALGEIYNVLEQADAPLLPDEVKVPSNGDGVIDGVIDGVVWADAAPIPNGESPPEVEEFVEPDWTLLVRLLGPVEVVDRDRRPAHFERSKTLELIAWLALHREHSTRAGARTALWELDVRDATFANVVSEARRAMARLVAPPEGEEWLGRTLTELLPLHDAVIADVDLVRARLERARLQPPELAIETLRPAVELIRDMPFAGTGYLWPDAEGISSNLVLLATGAATELAGHLLSMGDVDDVFWATGQGLKVLPGHEELIALRMRAHAKAGDLSGVRLEWETYERVLNADPWSDGEPAPKLVMLRRELLSS